FPYSTLFRSPAGCAGEHAGPAPRLPWSGPQHSSGRGTGDRFTAARLYRQRAQPVLSLCTRGFVAGLNLLLQQLLKLRQLGLVEYLYTLAPQGGGGHTLAGHPGATETAVIGLVIATGGTARLEHGKADAMFPNQGQRRLRSRDKGRGDIGALDVAYRHPPLQHCSTLPSGDLRWRSRSRQPAADLGAHHHYPTLRPPALQQDMTTGARAVVTHRLIQQTGTDQNLFHAGYATGSGLPAARLARTRPSAQQRVVRTPAEPADQTGPETAGRQHLVEDTVAHEHRQGAGAGRHIHGALRQMQAQLAAIPRLPLTVEVEHHRHGAQGVVLEPVQMPAVTGPRRVQRVMGLVIVQTQQQGAVEDQPQSGHGLNVGVLRGTGRAVIQPASMVAADLRHHLTLTGTPHGGRAQGLVLPEGATVAFQLVEHLGGEAALGHRPAL